ncbi:hypothetical protein O9H85_08200 [Paenibacillus filicis]|uniref:DUF433 domain-containing protein n=1 Tax=Paenibacillus gyeongsangnamensis TaxID=3388067 RepID=A0ABT4Q6G3_9BACL|nr:hypothetical protein [Paenibacillus filicis]MCZ8512414.1 hypothetical protein [Paenibacillus filicis]
MAVIIVPATTTDQWLTNGVVNTVVTWFNTNSGKSISDCVTANPTLSYQQVAWALAYYANGRKTPFTALPTQDSELTIAITLNQLW